MKLHDSADAEDGDRIFDLVHHRDHHFKPGSIILVGQFLLSWQTRIVGYGARGLQTMLGDDTIDLRDPRPISRDAELHLKRLRRWYPDERQGPAADTFEIGLVLAGAVSAGAYTAGVMDFLFEALDAWYARREDDDELPNHNVVVRVITGASAGGINGAIAAAACRYQFPSVKLDSVEEDGPNNPFFSTWVTGIDIRRLLDTSDLKKDAPMRSLLNSEALDELALAIVDMKGDSAARKWLEDPFKLLLTVTNLRGVPYEVRFTGDTDLSHEMVMHRDHLGFSVPAHANSVSASDPPPDLVPLAPVNNAEDLGWKCLAATALASGAFPLALSARSLSRPGSDYDYRFLFPYLNEQVVYSRPKVDREGTLQFSAVDGGTMNNEPFELARVELAGLKGSNPRRGNKARRAVIMVDPFADPRPDLPLLEHSLWATFTALLKAFKAQSRFSQIDLTLAEAGDVYSRFMIAPSRNGIRGSTAIASAGLRGFLGFFCEGYRLHDYMLGRANCQRFLRDWFVLPSHHTVTGEFSETSNPLFQHWPQSALDDNAYMSRRREGHRQIIPLVGSAAKPQTLALWPKKEFRGYESLKTQLDKRIDASYTPLANELVDAFCKGTSNYSWACRPAVRAAAWLVWTLWLKSKLRIKLKDLIDEAGAEVSDRAGDFPEIDKDD